jgi:hypothetical protein
MILSFGCGLTCRRHFIFSGGIHIVLAKRVIVNGGKSRPANRWIQILPNRQWRHDRSANN